MSTTNYVVYIAVYFDTNTNTNTKNKHRVAEIDPDTSVSRWTFEAAMRAAGAVCQAVDDVMDPNGVTPNAFCAVRPPGHHAGPNGIVTCRNDPQGERNEREEMFFFCLY